jgi:uncharacterized protein
VAAIVAGAAIGVAAGNRLPERVRDTVTQALGLVTLVLAGLNLMSLTDEKFAAAVTSGGTLLVILGAMVAGSVIGAALDLAGRLDALGGWLQRRLVRDDTPGSQAAFIDGFVTTSLVVAIGPLAILGSLADGLHGDISQLVLKSVMDGVICVAFAASLGWGVAAAALSVLVVQGTFTIAGATLGTFLPDAEIAAITATGGLLLLGVGLRLLSIKSVAVANMLPALILSPLLTWAVVALR